MAFAHKKRGDKTLEILVFRSIIFRFGNGILLDPRNNWTTIF
jgi:hypothetical protein